MSLVQDLRCPNMANDVSGPPFHDGYPLSVSMADASLFKFSTLLLWLTSPLLTLQRLRHLCRPTIDQLPSRTRAPPLTVNQTKQPITLSEVS